MIRHARTTAAQVAGVALLSLPLLACGEAGQHAQHTAADIQQQVAEATRHASSEARAAMTTHNLSLHADQPGVPKAEITPKGDLLIDGKAVPLSSEQRTRVLAYREQLLAVTQAGVEIGTDAAAMAGKAATGALATVFGGDHADFEREMDAAGKQIEAKVLVLCDRLPALRQAQDALSGALPAFRPYAGMDENDISECRKDAADARQQVRDAAKQTDVHDVTK